MKQLIPFIKIEATGNDFIFFDALDVAAEDLNSQFIARICQRHFSVGADGVVFMDGLKMSYFNADGSVGAMCGNGLRAAARFAHHLGKISLGKTELLEADDGIHEVIVKEQNKVTVEIRVQDEHRPEPDPKYNLPGNLKNLGYFNTGVPHLVLAVEADLDEVDVTFIGKKIRFDSTFQPQGTNVNFTSISEDGIVYIRTYERGVEAETLACGTGAAATFLAYERLGKVNENSLKIYTKGGLLTLTHQSAKIYLSGEASIAYFGTIPFESFEV